MEYTFRHYDHKDDPSLFSFHDDLSDVSLQQYFVWRMLLSMIIQVWGALIASVNFQLMRMAPFYQLARQGLYGDDAFLRDPSSMWRNARNPKKGGLLVWVEFFNVLLANIIAPTIASVVFISTNPPNTSLTGIAYEDDARQRISSVVIRSAGSRALTAILVLIAISCLSPVAILWQGLGLRYDPGGISGTTSLIGDDDKIFPTRTDVIGLRKTRFVLVDGNLRACERDPHLPIGNDTTSGEGHTSVGCSIYGLRLLGATIVFGIFLCIFCGVSAFTKLVYSLRRVPFLMTGLAVVYKQLWTWCEARFRVKEPFRQLRRGAVTPKNLFIDYTGVPTIFLPFSALANGHWMLCISAIVGSLTELIVVAVTCLGDISSYIFVSSRHYQATPGSYSMSPQVTEILTAGTPPLRTLLYFVWSFSMILPALMSVWVGWMFIVGVRHDRWGRFSDDPVKLGVVLG